MTTIAFQIKDEEKNFVNTMLKKLGYSPKVLTLDEMEEIGLANAIKQGKTGKHIDTEKFLKGIS